MGKSVKRFNDKKKAISGLDKLNDLLGTSSMNINLSLITKEVVYKVRIPLQRSLIFQILEKHCRAYLRFYK